MSIALNRTTHGYGHGTRKSQTSGLHVASLVASMRAHKQATPSVYSSFECVRCSSIIVKLEKCSVTCQYPPNTVCGANTRSSQIGVFSLSCATNVIKYLVTAIPMRLYTLPTTNMPGCLEQPNGNALFNVAKRPGSTFATTCPLFVTTSADFVLILYRINSQRDGVKSNPRTIRPMVDFLYDKWAIEKSVWTINALCKMFARFVQEELYTFEFNIGAFYILDDADPLSRTICWPWAETISGPSLETLQHTLELSLPKFSLGDSSTFTCLSFRSVKQPLSLGGGKARKTALKSRTGRLAGPRRLGGFIRQTTANQSKASQQATACNTAGLVRSQLDSSKACSRAGPTSLRYFATIVDADGPLNSFSPIDYSLSVDNVPLCSVLHDYQEELVCEHHGRILGSLLLMCHRAIVSICAISTNSVGRLSQMSRTLVGGQPQRLKCKASRACSLFMIPTETETTDPFAVQQKPVGVLSTTQDTIQGNLGTSLTDSSTLPNSNSGQDMLDLVHFRVCGEMQEYVQQIATAADNGDITTNYSELARRIANKLEEFVALLTKSYLYPILKL